MRHHTSLSALLALALLPISGARAATYGEGVWPELPTLPSSGLGEHDAAVIVGIERYHHYPDLRGATVSARQWAQWLETSHGVPSEHLVLLTDDDATCADIRRAARTATEQVEPGGTLWLVFVGRGALAPSGTDALLLGANADPGADIPANLGLGLGSLMDSLDDGSQKRAVLVLDTAFVPPSASLPGAIVEPSVLQPGPSFSARGSATALLGSNTGKPLPSLPDLRQPPFSYLLLGALRGWGDADGNGRVTAEEALAWVQRTVGVFHTGLEGTPAGWGPLEGVTLSQGKEFAPDIAEVSWRAAERRIGTRIHELDESEAMLRADASAVWQAVLGAYGMGGPDAQASVIAFADRWRLSSVKVDHMTRWLQVPELEDAQALLLATGVRLGEPEQRTVEGERYVQLQEEIAQFARRNAYKGVEAAYAEMLGLAGLGVAVLPEDHLHGARAARQLGDAQAVRERLMLAVEAGHSTEAVQWLNDLEQSYAPVTIGVQRREEAPLEPASMPFAPDRRAAVLFAQETLEDTGQFAGLLPAGVYRLGEELVVVAPGDPPLTINVQKARRNGRH